MLVREIKDHVFETATYTSIDYNWAEKKFEERFIGVGGCTAVWTKTQTGEIIIGRNMDLTISNKPAYIVTTVVPGKYPTTGIAYTFADGPDYEDVRANGIDDEFAGILPFLCTDVVNAAGLYIEINMRSSEYYPDGSSKFACTHTNENASHRICACVLQQYVGQNCATVEEAVEYIKNDLDLYTPKNSEIAWNFCFMLADSSGKHGILEIAENKVVWLEGESAQANFYLTKDFADKEEYRCGLDRCAQVRKGVNSVTSNEDMLELMKSVTYGQVYTPNPQYDVRTEYAGIEPDWTANFVLDEANRELVQKRINKNINIVQSSTRQELMDIKKYWETTYTTVTNLTQRKMIVRFFEDDNRIVELTI